MSLYYKAKRTKNIFDGKSSDPFRLSRSKIDLFVQCPRCFYLDVKLGVGRPPGFPMSLNNAVDTLMKKEFDIHRVKGTKHPLFAEYGIDAVPLKHKDIDVWRDALRHGISTHHKATNLILRGGIDDVWVNPEGEYIIVDYKATSKDAEVTLDAEWQDGYKRQMEIYQWLFRQNGFSVSKTGYFVYVNGKTDRKAFDGKLEFDVKIIPYKGDDSWVEGTVTAMKKCLDDARVPLKGQNCDYCDYIDSFNDTIRERSAAKNLPAGRQVGTPVSPLKKKKTADDSEKNTLF